jgi:hypothetical protein
MEQELLSKLKIKPQPKSIETIEILLKKPDKTGEFDNADVKLKTLILDKTGVSDNTINRDDFLKNLYLQLDVKPIVIPESVKVFDAKEDQEEQYEPFAKSKKPGLTVTLIINIKNTTVKFTITKESLAQDIDIDAVTDTSVFKKERITKKPTVPGIKVFEGPMTDIEIKQHQELINRLPKKEPELLIKSPNYYMNNREIFINFINSLFESYKHDLMVDDDPDNPVYSCDKKSDEFVALTHQKIVRDYINIYTPYRGVLLYHGLGSGKTCSSIGIAEGLKHNLPVIIMTPASLRANYMEELKKCGDVMYKKTHHWEFLTTSSNPVLAGELSRILSLDLDYINKNGGAWFVDGSKDKSNYDSLPSAKQSSLNDQLNKMIQSKYQFINYNGMRMNDLQALSRNFTINPFSNRVIIVDEAHNLISRIINKLKRPQSLSMKIYEYLMSAENCKIIFLSGTPMINYPNEISILFNMLRGYISTYTFKLKIGDQRKIDQPVLYDMFKKTARDKGGLTSDLIDYIDYKPSTNILVLTRNPFNFNSIYRAKDSGELDYNGVKYNAETGLTHNEFIEMIVQSLEKNNIAIDPDVTKIENYKALPDNYDVFRGKFIDDENNVKNNNLLKYRIVGLTSFFPDIYQLLPKYSKSEDFHVIKIEMSDFQFGAYEEARVQERILEASNKKKKKKQTDDIYQDTVSTYRIFSRAFCNFVFPKPDIRRPFPNDDDTIVNAIDNENMEAIVEVEGIKEADVIDADNVDIGADDGDGDMDTNANIDGEANTGEVKSMEQIQISSLSKNKKKLNYERKIREALKSLERDSQKFLTRDALQTYSPKFLNIYENIVDVDHKGLHLIYSHFRTLEGIGILKLVLEANGFVQFKVKKNAGGEWMIDVPKEMYGKPKFALYTGTETVEEKEMIRNIFNNNTNILPASIVSGLKTMGENNFYGEIIKILMITASGAEGINLKNVRYVHITEPYWHPVRIDQVVGRARRICSHHDLPKELQTVEVFLYLMTFSKAQLESELSLELRAKDKSKLVKDTPYTSDEALHEISSIKESINRDLLKTIKESAIDCSIHVRGDNKEQLQCFSVGNPSKDRFTYLPNIDKQHVDKVASINKEVVTWTPVEIKIQGITYGMNQETGEVYDLESCKTSNPLLIGYFKQKGDKYVFEKI